MFVKYVKMTCKRQGFSTVSILHCKYNKYNNMPHIYEILRYIPLCRRVHHLLWLLD